MPIAPRRRRPRRLATSPLLAVAVLALAGCSSTAALPVTAPTAGGEYLVHAAAIEAAASTYRDYVAEQAELLRERTASFAAAVRAGDVRRARQLYPVARAPWERIQVAVEDAGLDDAIDGTGVGLEPGEEFTGFKRLERDLWVTGLRPDSAAVAATLLADVDTLAEGVADLEVDGHTLCGVAKELIDFAVTTTLPGRENRYAGTDLSDLSARVEGSKAAVDALRPLLTTIEPGLLETVDRRFAELRAVLDGHRSGSAFRPYDQLAPEDLAALADALDAVGEPVSKIGGKVMV